MNQNQQLFMQWLQENDPQTYQDAMIEATDRSNAQNGLMGMGADTMIQTAVPRGDNAPQKSWWSNFTDSVSEIGSRYIKYKSDKKLMNVQLRRARQGLPPVKTGLLAPGTRPDVFPVAFEDVSKYMIPAAIGIGVLFLLLRKK